MERVYFLSELYLDRLRPEETALSMGLVGSFLSRPELLPLFNAPNMGRLVELLRVFLESPFFMLLVILSRSYKVYSWL